MDSRTPHRLSTDPTLGSVVGAMKRFAHGPQGKENLTIRGLVEDIIADVESGDYAGECLAVYYWVHEHVRYSRDPTGIELVKSPLRTLKTKTGDCDDIATLLAAMLMTIGNRCMFLLVGFHPGAPPSHVFCGVKLPSGNVLVLDPVANRVTKGMLADVSAGKLVDVGETDDERTDADDASLGYERGGRDPDAGRQVPRTFSVYDYARKTYRYFEGLAGPPPATGGFRQMRGRSLHAEPEAIAAVLPAGARQVGEGKRAKGTIATLGGLGSSGGGLFANPWVQRAGFAVVASGVGYGLWRLWRGKKKRRAA